jgi:hypothetical protein
MAVISDIIESNSGRLTLQGWEFERIYFVSELASVGSDMLVEAVATAGVALGDSHPSIATAFVFEILPESIPTAGDQVKITYVYRQFDVNYEYNIDAGQETQVTDEYWADRGDDGTGILTKMEAIEYTFPADYIHNKKFQGVTDPQGVEANIFINKPKIIISRTERVAIAADGLSGHSPGIPLTGNIIVDRNIEFANKLNLAEWNIRPSDPEGIWICNGIQGVSINGGLAWRVTYTFTRDGINKWVFTANYLDPTTGFPEPDAEIGNGRAEYDMYLLRNFTLLELQ